ncbi:hypothetical protein GGF46_005078 [Coemansia sp. RSA 552]|nr:hypothetical protein GGF46_005078 [Coemansia sp. RSA 552]
MLQLCAAELKRRDFGKEKELVWVDIGGGTGWNIEQMDRFFDLNRFWRIYLVDLCRPLCRVAERRFKAKGWTNIRVVCQDAASFRLPTDDKCDGLADLITMSYSLSMIENFHPAVDRIKEILRPHSGVLGVADFYVSGSSPVSPDCGAGMLGYKCGWLMRTFWQHWFELDHVYLHPSRRSYLAHRFDPVKVYNGRNHFVVPYLVQIPYYIWLGTSAPEHPAESLCKSVATAPVSSSSCSSTGGRSGLGDGSCTMLGPSQPRGWVRLPYQPSKPEHAQFSTYIYGFTWEDPQADIKVLDLQQGDRILAITSAGDNALAYAAHTEGLVIHCVDMNPCQNHLLELKLAALRTLNYNQFWNMFGTGRLPGFKQTLDGELSAELSSAAYQYWRANSSAFGSDTHPVSNPLAGHNLYTTGYSGLALRVLNATARLLGVHMHLHRMLSASSLKEQALIWHRHILHKLLGIVALRILDNPVAMWRLMGVPISQWNMLHSEGSMSQYVRDTLDPVATTTSFSCDNHFYHMLIAQQYSPECCPEYLTKNGFSKLQQQVVNSKAHPMFCIHTATVVDVLWKMYPGELSKAVVMDHMDWLTAKDVDAEVRALKHALRRGGFVLWRSAARIPWYVANFEAGGFRVEPLAIRQPNTQVALDRVNMYASFYKATSL